MPEISASNEFLPKIGTPSLGDDGSDNPRATLAQMKTLAEEGRDAPLINGYLYVLWGGLIGTAALLSFFNISSILKLGATGSYLIWIGAIVAGWILSFVYGPKASRKRGASTIGNRTAQAVWFAVGISTTGTWFTIMFIHDNFTNLGVPPYFLFQIMFPLAFMLYGVAFFATASAARVAWLRWVAVGAWVFAWASLMLMGSAYQMLLAALG